MASSIYECVCFGADTELLLDKVELAETCHFEIHDSAFLSFSVEFHRVTSGMEPEREPFVLMLLYT